jgi:methylated-DNA-[protein]-cysteine S-methyltransferase
MDMLSFDTAIGTCGLRWSDAGITRVLLPGKRELVDEGVPPATVLAAAEAITALLDGEKRDLRDIALDFDGVDDFRRAVYEATREIQAGETATYGEIARTIGDPGAARGVGSALGSNPFAIIVPCHRVLASTGALHGFSAPGGIATKRRMLEIEQAPGFTQEPLFR